MIKFKLINATKNDAEKLINYKLQTTIDNAMTRQKKLKLKTLLGTACPFK